ncbi:MAG: glycosyltransferase family 8 protein [Holosporaceae bacterium]|jgi:lipopolysaccharide biosynthesis glycosyltransferase|nr:glycosyltransferase family 8 protein [Holosporaceae bacterium]
MYKLNEEKVFCNITDGIAIIINYFTGVSYSMNTFGSMVLEKIIGGYSRDDILALLRNITDIPLDIDEKLDHFINELLRAGVIIISNEKNEDVPMSGISIDTAIDLPPIVKKQRNMSTGNNAITSSNTVINIAFCFDENFYLQAKDSINSLLCNSVSKCHYNMYCIVDKKTRALHAKELENAVRQQDAASSIIFLEPNSDFDQSFLWKTVAIYYRFMLPILLPYLDKIIYADVDTIFNADLLEANQINIGANLIAGVKDIVNTSSMWKSFLGRNVFKYLACGTYINSGFLIMNLKEIRNQNLYAQWVDLSKRTGYACPDQDILNYTCHGKKLFLPLKYNFVPQIYNDALQENIYSQEEFTEATLHPVMIHYAGNAKFLLNGKAFLEYVEKAKKKIVNLICQSFEKNYMYKLNEEKVFCDITDGVAIIINFITGVYYSINVFGSMVFERIIGGYSRDEILTLLKNIPNIPTNIDEKLDHFINELLLIGIIIANSEESTDISKSGISIDAAIAAEDDFEMTITEYSDIQAMLIADPIHDVEDWEGWSPALSQGY